MHSEVKIFKRCRVQAIPTLLAVCHILTFCQLKAIKNKCVLFVVRQQQQPKRWTQDLHSLLSARTYEFSANATNHLLLQGC